MSVSRAPTAFELFLQRRQQAATDASGISEASRYGNVPASVSEELARMLPPPLPPSPSLPPPPPMAAAAGPPAAAAPAPPRPRPLTLGALRSASGRPLTGGGGGSAGERTPGRGHILRCSAPDLVPQVVASLPSPRLAAAAIGPDLAPPSASFGGTTAMYGALATAAASLASAAHKLAAGAAGNRTVAASYETLAQAAADLAASACQIRPLSTSASGSFGGAGPRRSFVMTTQGRPSDAARSAAAASGGAAAAALPRAVDPIASAAAAAEAAVAAAATKAAASSQPPPLPRPQPHLHPARSGSGAGSGTSVGRARVPVPRFPGYNPLVHLLESGLPPPGSAAAQRPTTSSPITHQLVDGGASLRPSPGGNTSAAAAPQPSRRSRRRRSSGPPGELSRLPVLGLGPDGQPLSSSASLPWPQSHQQQETGFGAATADWDVWYNDGSGAGGGVPRHGDEVAAAAVPRSQSQSQLADPHALLAPYTDVRLSQWPPTEPVTVADMEQDEVDVRYNKLLSALRERVYTRGAGRLAAAFRDLDREGCGLISRRDFGAALRAMNLGASGLVDDKVVDLLLLSMEAAAASGGAGGGAAAAHHVSYGDFVNALRFGTLPWRGYNRKLRHRQGGDPDQPIGPPQAAAGSPPYGLVYGNNNSSGGAAGGAGGIAAAAVSAAPPVAAAAAAAAARRLFELRSAFRSVDHNGDGVVEWSEFREALRRVGEQNRLQLSDAQLMQIYKDADPDFSTGVDYEAFVSAYGSGGGGSSAAAAANGRPSNGALAHGHGYGAGGAEGGAAGGAGGGGSVPGAAAGLHSGRPAPRHWRSQDLPRTSQPPPPFTALTPLTVSSSYASRQEPYSSSELRNGAGADGGGVGHRGSFTSRPGTGAGAGPGWGASEAMGGGGDALSTSGGFYGPDAFREMHAGAAAMLRRLGSVGGGGRSGGFRA